MKKNIITIVLALLLLATCSYIIYDKVFYKERETNVEANNKNDKTEVKEEQLDINSRLVQSLYNKVVSANDNGKYWMYDYHLNKNETTDYFVSKSDEKTKMNLVGNNLNNNKTTIIECDNSIPNTVKIDGYDYKSACYARSEGAYGYIPTSYEKSYVEMIYKDLFGNDAKLDTSIDIQFAMYAPEMYHYIESIDKYVLYVAEGGGTSATTYSGMVTKAIKLGNKLKITEKVTVTDPEETKNYNYVYTFKLEDDEMYTFVSREKES